jgi:two-component system chemotaxis response regulator CheB
VVIGGSAGGIAALREVLCALPNAFPAPVLVALHAPPRTDAARVVLRGRHALPLRFAEDGDELQRGRILLAPRGRHMTVEGDRVRLVDGPEEHRFRPAIDPLFRSAAASHARRVVGVVLSGLNADGTAGLLNIVLHGGTALVQDPDGAEYATMPRSALLNVPWARCVPMAQMAEAIARCTERISREEAPAGLRVVAPGRRVAALGE